MIAVSNVLIYVAIFATSSFVALSWKASFNRQSIQMSSNENLVRINDVSKQSINRAVKATAAVASAFSVASAANAYG